MAGGGAKRAGDVFDLDRLTQLIELMKEHGLTELDLRQEKQHIRLARGTGRPVVEPPGTLPAPAPAAVPRELPPPPAADEAGEKVVTITSPMVGTFYLRSNPESEPYVRVGDRVEPDTVICIIEAMKVFNEIPAEISGKVVAVLLDNEEAVDFGRPMFKIDPSR